MSFLKFLNLLSLMPTRRRNPRFYNAPEHLSFLSGSYRSNLTKVRLAGILHSIYRFYERLPSSEPDGDKTNAPCPISFSLSLSMCVSFVVDWSVGFVDYHYIDGD